MANSPAPGEAGCIAYLMLAVPPLISTDSPPERPRRSPFGMVTKQPAGQMSSVVPGSMAMSVRPLGSVIRNWTGVLSELVRVAAATGLVMAARRRETESKRNIDAIGMDLMPPLVVDRMILTQDHLSCHPLYAFVMNAA